MKVLLFCLSILAANQKTQSTLLIVVGAPGTAEYKSQFTQWADLWEKTASKSYTDVIRIGEDNEGKDTDLERLRTFLSKQIPDGLQPLWIILIGHGTYDGSEAKFNLRGPDLSDIELAKWLQHYKRPLAIINCTSASAPFLNRLSKEGRVVITATKSGHESNFSRFGQFLAESLDDSRSDLDKDGQVSLLESFLTANHKVVEYYRTESRLATEHALIDDNGDNLGTLGDWFRGIRATRRAKDGAQLDGLRASQFHLVMSDRESKMPTEARQRRDRIELAIAELRDKKSSLNESEYYKQLEPLMIELARIYQASSKELVESTPPKR